jgi:hypothetical protein
MNRAYIPAVISVKGKWLRTSSIIREMAQIKSLFIILMLICFAREEMLAYP